MPTTNNPASLILEEIRAQGTISFARFMELALYAPGVGYYERQRVIGRRGDFFTSVSIGPLFGELLAFQFAQWLDRDDAVDKLQIVEAGAHQGVLAADILAWMQRRRPDLFCRLEYCLVEPSPTHRAWQEKTLHPWLSNVKWSHDLAWAGCAQAARIIFGNELLDAMPVHRFAWDTVGEKWNECRVAAGNSGFMWLQAPVSAELAATLPAVPPALAAVLPDGYVIEHSPAAVAWWAEAAQALGKGILLTIDYGLTAEEQFRPERREGTLRTYSRHHASAGVLDHPGECDITTHINFSAIEAAGRAAGLKTGVLVEQDKFLTQILAQTEASPAAFDPWNPARTKQFQTLTHPDHLGRAFRVLIQSR